MNHAASELALIPKPLDLRKTLPWIMFIVFFGVLNETVFNVSTPAIARQYALTPSGVSWVVTTFIVFFGIGSVIFGRLSDIFSLKRLIVIGVCTYAAGSILGFVLQAFYPAIIAARVIQGVGASAIPALIMVVVTRHFPPSDRGKVFGTITSTVAFAAGVGPVVGGFVSGTFHWTYLFVIPLFTLISIPFFLRALPEEQRKKGSVDVLGAALVAIGVATFILFLSFTSLYYLGASVLAIGAFIIHIRRSSNPFIEPSLFRNKPFRAGMLVGFIIFSIAIGVTFVIPLMLSALRGLSTREIGLIMFPGAISGVVFGTVGGTLADKKGNGFVIAIGFVALFASLLLICALLGISPWFTAAALLMTYIGFTLIQTALVNSVSQTLQLQETGVGMGLFNLVTFVSGAVGAALVARSLEAGWLNFRLNPLLSESKAYPYSNLMMIFAVCVALGGFLYFRSYGKRAARGSS
jgi:DHA2 family metal-tetracycline-proton antiporter-like MFS transporter